MQLYFIRHGESTNNLIWNRTGSSDGRSEDPELTETGRQQAEILAGFLHQPARPNQNVRHDLWNVWGFGISHLYTSLMVRAVQTGSIISSELDLPLVAWIDLHEHGGIVKKIENDGSWAGMPGKTRSFFEQKYPNLHLPEDLDERGWWRNRPFETSREALDRAGRVVQELIAKHGDTDDCVTVISHAGFFNFLLMTMLGLDLDGSGSCWLELNNASISRIDLFKDKDGQMKQVIKYVNRVDYLPADLVTPRTQA